MAAFTPTRILSAIRQFHASRESRTVKRARSRRLFRIEQLEERSLLATIQWINMAGGAWNVGTNWQGGKVPGSLDDAEIPALTGSGNPTVTTNSAVTVKSLTASANVVMSGGAFSATSISQLAGTFTITGGVFSNSRLQVGTLNVNGTASMLGNITVAVGADLRAASNSTIQLTDDTRLTVNGNMSFDTGSKLQYTNKAFTDAELFVNGTLNFNGTTVSDTTTTSASTSLITVSSGGRMTARNSTFSINKVTLQNGSVINSGDLIGNSFLGPLSVPANSVGMLSRAGGGQDNVRFQDIILNAGSFTSGTLNLSSIGTDTTSLRYLFDGNFTVGVGATMNVAAGVRVVLANSASDLTLTINGTGTFDNASTLNFANSSSREAQILVNGTLNFRAATVNDTTTSSLTVSRIVVANGARMTATNSSFSVSELVLQGNVVFNSGDWRGNSFLGPIWLPARIVGLLSRAGGGEDNVRFQDINILSGAFNAGELNLSAIGLDTSSLRYVFDGNFTLGVGTTMNVGAAVRVAFDNNNADLTLSINGTANFDTTSKLIFANSGSRIAEIIVNGTMNFKGTLVTDTTGSALSVSRITVASGGRMTAKDSDFAIDAIVLQGGSILNPGDWSGSSFSPIWLPARFVGMLSRAGGGEDNVKFEDINLNALGSISTGSLDLLSIGVDTTSLRYLFDGNFVVGAAATMNVGAGVRVLFDNSTADLALTINGTAFFDTGSTLTFANSGSRVAEVIVNGSLNFKGTTVVDTTGGSLSISRISVSAGGRLTATNSSIQISELNAAASALVDLAVLDGTTRTVGVGGISRVLNTNSIDVRYSSSLVIPQSIRVGLTSTSTASLKVSYSSTMRIAGSLLGRTQSSANFLPQGTVVFNGAGTSAVPQFLEVMGADRGPNSSGFANDNFAFGKIELANSTYVRLTNTDINSGATREALYVNTLIIPSGSKLDLNGQTMYVRAAQIATGGLVNGTLIVTPNIIADGGPLAFAFPTPGTIDDSQRVSQLPDEWTFTAPQDGPVSIQVNPAAAIAPQLPRVRVELLNANNTVLKFVENTANGAGIVLDSDSLLQGQAYKIRVRPHSAFTTLTGNYVITLINAATAETAFSIAAAPDSTSKSEGNTGSVSYTYNITRVGDLRQPSSVSVNVSGTGSNPANAADFVNGVLPSGIISFAANETTKSFTVQVRSDTDFEADESFSVSLTNPTNGNSINVATVVSTILNDDAQKFSDLIVSSISPPIAAQSGQRVTIGWTEKNNDAVAITGSWFTSVRVTNTATNLVLASQLPFFTGNNIAPGASVTRSLDIVLRDGPAGVGTFRIDIQVDSAGNVTETNEANNAASASFTSTLAAYPQLSVSQVVVPTDVQLSVPFNVSWTVLNSGTGALTKTIRDRVYLSTDDKIDLTDNLITTLDNSTKVPLAPGTSYTQSVSVLLPLDPLFTLGAYQILVQTDALNDQFENDETDNVRSAPVNIGLPPLPDLVVDNITASKSVAVAGQSVNVTWTLRNQGNAPAIGPWTDRVMLSDDSTIGSDIAPTNFPYTDRILLGGSIERTQEFQIPAGLSGSFRFVVLSDINNTVQEFNRENNNAAIDDALIVIDARPSPNLVVNSVNALTSGLFSGQRATVDWVVKNTGNESTNSSGWIDRLYLSADGILSDDDEFLGQAQNVAALNVGDSYRGTLTVTLPEDAVGDRSFIVFTDALNRVIETGNESDNTKASATTTIQLTPPPDLIVTKVITPSNAFESDTTLLSYTVRNQGTGPTRLSQWRDQVYLSFNGNDIDPTDRLLTTVTHNGSLAVNAEYSVTDLALSLPANRTGNAFIIVRTDSGNVIYEHSFEGNNDKASDPVQIVQNARPDLVVSSIKPISTATAGQPITVSFVIANNSVIPTRQSSWKDAVYLSSDRVLNKNEDIFLGTRNRNGILLGEQSESHEYVFRLPNTIEGDYYLVVETDAENSVPEFDETNNTMASANPLRISIDPPDLKAVSISSAASAKAGRALSVAYTVTNIGRNPTPNTSWSDAIYLSTDNQWDASDTLIDRRERFGALVSGQSENRSINITLPPDQFGSQFLIVKSDSTNVVYELDNENNNLAKPITIEDDRPDLNIVSFVPQLGTRQVIPGGTVSFDYSVENRGIGSTFGASWKDRVVLSSDLIAGNADDVTLAEYTSPTDLNPGRSYFRLSESVVIPSRTPEGLYRMFLMTDSRGGVQESNELNNVMFSIDFSVTTTPIDGTPLPDLQITNLTAPSTIGSGQKLPISWTVRNSGIAKTNSDQWNDAVWLSKDGNIDDSDILIGNFTRYNGLAVNESYTRSTDWPIDIEFSGNYFVIVQTDSKNIVVEGVIGETNNKRVSSPATTITLSPTADLRVSSLNVPMQAFSGRTVGINWAVQNAGGGGAKAPWADSFYLSLDQIFDRSTDIPIGFVDRNGDLAAGQSYSANATLQIPTGLGGAYYLFAITDSTNRVYERQVESNNTSFQPITLSHLPPADLVVGDITIPNNTVIGEKASITFTIQNVGLNPARGGWYDSLYLSADDKWDIDDGYFGRVLHSADVPANGSYTTTLEAPLPGVVPGNYKVIVRSDIRNNLIETTETNNLKATLDSVAMDATTLTLGVPKSGTITTNGAVYYKVVVPAGETVAIEFDSAATVGSTELYTSFDKMPRRSQSDSLQPMQPDQRIVISSTQGGTYYILAFGNDVDKGSSSFSILARIVPFSVFDTNFGQGGTAGDRTIQINGAKFDRSVTATLVDAQGKSIEAVRYTRTSDTRLYATFDLRNLDLGSYTVKLSKGTTNETVLVPNSLEVVFAKSNSQPVSLTRPDTFNRLRGTRPPAVIPVMIGWRNGTLNDIPVPLIHFSATDPFAMTLEDANAGKTVSATEFLGMTESDGPKDILLAGETASASFYVKPLQVDTNSPPIDIHYVAEYFYDDAQAAYNWDYDLSQLDLSYLNDDEAIEAIRTFKLDRGQTLGALRQTLVEGLQRAESAAPSNLSDASRFLLQDAFDRFVAARQTSVVGKVRADSFAIDYNGLVVSLSEVGGSATFSRRVLADGSFVFAKLPAGNFKVTVSGGAAKVPDGLQIQVSDNRSATLNISLVSAPKTTAVELAQQTPTGTSSITAPWITRPGKIDVVLSGNVLESVQSQLTGIPHRVELIGDAPLGFTLNQDGTYRYLSSEISAFVVHYDLVMPDTTTRVGNLFGAEIRSRGVIAITLKNNFTRDVRSQDPNDIIGPVGYGPEKWVSAAERLGYTIRFENDPKNATSAAQTVQIEQTLDSDLDPSSFQFGNFGFGGREFKVPSGRQTLNLDLDLKADLGIIVRVFARIDAAQRKISWTFSSISPETGTDTTNPDDGFLPLNLLPPQGDGFVTYSVRAKRSATSGSQILAQARIIFDGNAPIDTPEIFNTLDVTKPVSRIATEPIPSQPRLQLKWNGDDGEVGAGLSVFDVYVSENGSRYRPWLLGTPRTEAEYPTQPSRTYEFITIAKDNVGNGEDESKIPDAHRPIADVGGPYATIEGKPITLNGSGRDPDPGQTLSYEWDFDYDGFHFNVDSTQQNPQVTFTDGPATRVIGLRVKDNSSEGLYSVVAVTTAIIDNAAPELAVASSNVSGFIRFPISNTGSWKDGPDDLVALDATLGTVVKNVDGTWAWSYTPTGPLTNQSVTITAKDKDGATSTTTFVVTATTTPVTSSITSSHNTSAVYGTSIDFTIRIAPPNANDPNPVGQVQLQIDGENFGEPISLQAGIAMLTASGLAAGSHEIVALFSDPSGVYSDQSSSFVQNVAKATLTVKADNAEIQLGDPIPVLTYTVDGFVLGESADAITGAPELSVSSPTAPGAFPIVASVGTLGAANYGFQFVSGVLTVRIKPELTLQFQKTEITEGDFTDVTITRNTPIESALKVQIVANPSDQFDLPNEIEIPAGRSSIVFRVGAKDDKVAMGDRSVSISAQADGFLPGTITTKIIEDERPTLTLNPISISMSEKGGSADITISRNTPATSDLVIDLKIEKTGIANLPSTVTILAGQTSAQFKVSAIDNSVFSGNVASTIAATALGFNSPELSLTIIEDDPSRPWKNPKPNLAFDVNDDGQVTALDVLRIISLLSTPLRGELPATRPPSQQSTFVDVNGDGFLSPLDALLTIEYLTKNRPAAGEGEMLQEHLTAQPEHHELAWMSDLIDDVAKQRSKARFGK